MAEVKFSALPAAGSVAGTDVFPGVQSNTNKKFTLTQMLQKLFTLGKTAYTQGVMLSDAASIATDAGIGNVFTVTLAGNRTMAAPSNLVNGATYIWVVKQDATGSRTLSWNAVFKWPAGTAPTLSTAANSVDIISGVSDGTNIYCTSTLDFQ